MLKLNKVLATTGAAFTMGLMSSAAHATAVTGTSANSSTFDSIGASIVGNIAGLPGLLTAISYMMGLIFSVLGVLKIKDHVENPTQTQLKDGAIRLAAGGGLFLIPVVTGAMQNLLGDGTDAIVQNKVNKIDYTTN